MTTTSAKPPLSGRFSPLRYPGGKGKLARFVGDVVRANKLEDGTYVEPYAGGAAVAWELLLTGLVRKVHVNDLSRPIYAFWLSVLENTEVLTRLIADTPVNIDNWAKQKSIFANPEQHDDTTLGFAMFYLNRTNRSGILNGGPIGGKAQTGKWLIDARYNRLELIQRIERIARMRNRITLTNLDAEELLLKFSPSWNDKTLVYLDPPYYEKGPDLYYKHYKNEDHGSVADEVHNLTGISWIVSYDDVSAIHDLYNSDAWLQYTIGYSARRSFQGREAMFFSPNLIVPPPRGAMIEVDRWTAFDSLPYRKPTTAGSEGSIEFAGG